MQALRTRATSAFRSASRLQHGDLVSGWAKLPNRTLAASAHSAAPAVKLFIDGQFIDSKAKQFVDVHDPATQEVVCRVPLVRSLVCTALLRL